MIGKLDPEECHGYCLRVHHSLPEWFAQTSDKPYDRHQYELQFNGQSIIFDDYDQLRAYWFQSAHNWEGCKVNVLDHEKNKQQKNRKEVLNSDGINITTTNKGGSMSWMTEALNATALSLWAGLDYFSSHCLSCNWWPALLALPLLRRGTLTDWQVVTLRVLIFLQRQSRLLLTLWVILFFYFGVLSLREISSGGANLGDSGLLWRSICLCSHRFYASTVRN